MMSMRIRWPRGRWDRMLTVTSTWTAARRRLQWRRVVGLSPPKPADLVHQTPPHPRTPGVLATRPHHDRVPHHRTHDILVAARGELVLAEHPGQGGRPRLLDLPPLH